MSTNRHIRSSLKLEITVVKGINVVALRGGLGSITGSINPVAVLWDRVTVPSEFDHIITILASVICVPNPLRIYINKPVRKL